MFQPPHDLVSLAEGTRDRPILADTLKTVRRFPLYVDIRCDRGDTAGWITAAELLSPESTPLTDLMGRFKARGFAASRKAASASLLLRVGWAGGFAIASYLACRRVPYLRDYALHFAPNTLLRGMWIRGAQFVGLAGDMFAGSSEWMECPDANSLRVHLLRSLVEFSEPIVAVQHD